MKDFYAGPKISIKTRFTRPRPTLDGSKTKTNTQTKIKSQGVSIGQNSSVEKMRTTSLYVAAGNVFWGRLPRQSRGLQCDCSDSVEGLHTLSALKLNENVKSVFVFWLRQQSCHGVRQQLEFKVPITTLYRRSFWR